MGMRMVSARLLGNVIWTGGESRRNGDESFLTGNSCCHRRLAISTGRVFYRVGWKDRLSSCLSCLYISPQLPIRSVSLKEMSYLEVLWSKVSDWVNFIYIYISVTF